MTETPALPRRTVWALGLSQLIAWGVSYYLIGVLGERIAADLGWGMARVQGGFALSLLVMGAVSPLAGRMMDRQGGRRVMGLGSVLLALGCLGLALAREVVGYYAAWAVLGLAMRLTLYDAAFAALARIGGPGARRAMSQITLLGGLASTVFWPLGHLLAEHLGWRGACLAYAGAALLTLPLHLLIPSGRAGAFQARPGAPAAPALARDGGERRLAGALYAAIILLLGVLNAAMSAHMITLLYGLGLEVAAAVWVATLRGIGQSAARLAEILSGSRMGALGLNLLATGGLALSFVLSLWSGNSVTVAVIFSLLYGAANGLTTITRGALPLVLFDHRAYGRIAGALITPGLLLSAVAPLAYVPVIEGLGAGWAMGLGTLLAFAAFLASLALWWRFGEGRPVGAAAHGKKARKPVSMGRRVT